MIMAREFYTLRGSKPSDVLSTFNEVEEIIKELGTNPESALFHELTANIKAKISHLKLFEEHSLETADIIGYNLKLVGGSFTSGEPNSTRFLELRLTPLWVRWKASNGVYSIAIVYRDEKNKILKLLEKFEEKVIEILRRI